jgi:hypothetical protein
MGRRIVVPLLLAVGTLSAVLVSQPRTARADAPPLAQSSHINAGDLIVDFGMSCGSEECFGQESDGFDILTPAGEYKGTLRLDGYTSSPAQLAFENSGKIIASDGNEVDRFGHSGGPRTRVILPDEENFPFLTSFALDGPENLYASVSVGGNDVIWRYERFGVAYGSPEAVPVETLGEGYAIQFVGLFGCTLTYGRWAQFKRYDICTNEQLADYPQAALQFRELPVRVLLDGSVLTVDGGLPRRYETDGTVTEYGSGETCIVSADAYNNVLYVVDQCSESIESYVLSTGAFLATVKHYDSGELEARDAYPVSVRVYDRVAPPKPVIFVHGLQQRRGDAGFGPILADADVAPSVTEFGYFQDADAATTCPVRPRLSAQSPAPPAAPLPITDTTSAQGYPCDSESDFGLNVLLLYQDVQMAYYGSGEQRVVLLGYSMGGALIRGPLSYSASLGEDPVASTMIDSVFVVAGAMDGSAGAQCKLQGKCPPGAPKWLIDFAQRYFVDGDGIDTARPAVHELLPRSDWYKWANSFTLPNIGYYEAHAEMRVVRVRNRLFFGVDKDTVWDAGDGIVPPGTSDPFDTPPFGGARFSRPATAEQWSWAFCSGSNGEFLGSYTDWDGAYSELSIAANLAVTNSDCFHTNIKDKTESDALKIVDCVSQDPDHPVTLAAQVLSVLKGKLGKQVYACPLH